MTINFDVFGSFVQDWISSCHNKEVLNLVLKVQILVE
jgi:hypothetical protein